MNRDEELEGEANFPILPIIGQIARLEEFRSRLPDYGKPCPFVQGDLVRSRADAPFHGSGLIALVLETRVRPAAPWLVANGQIGTSTWGMMVDMRVVTLCGDVWVPTWAESFWFDKYVEGQE